MLTTLRRYRRTLHVALFIIIAAFVGTSVYLGAGSSFGRGDTDRMDAVATAATVNGEKIPSERYERLYRAYYTQYAQMNKERFSPELAEVLGLKQQVVDVLVREAIVVQKARAEGLEATDEELNNYIHGMSQFEDNGRFSLKKYDELLRANGLNKPGFESELRRFLTQQKMESTIKNGVKVSDSEVEQAYVNRREEIRAAWALVDLNPILAGVNPTDEELKKHLADNPDEFRRGERRKIQYASIPPAPGFAANVTDAEVEKNYKENAKDYEQPAQVKAQHILIAVPQGAANDVDEKARVKAAEITKRAKAGEDFAKLATENSGDAASAAKGGDLGFFRRGQMVAQFDEAAFKLKKGEITAEAVRSPFGYHVIKVNDIKEETRTPLATVAAGIRARLINEASERAAKTRADELRPKLQAAKDFLAEAKALGLNPIETIVSKGSRGGDPVEDTAFGLSAGGVSLPVKTPAAGTVVLKLTEVLAPSVPPLEEARDRVLASLKRKRADAMALERAQKISSEAAGGDFLAVAKKAGATTGETGKFTRGKPDEKLVGDAMLAAFRTPANTVSAPVKVPQGYYVIKVLERSAPDPGGLATEREKLQRELTAQKQGLAWESWVSDLKKGAKIDVAARIKERG